MGIGDWGSSVNLGRARTSSSGSPKASLDLAGLEEVGEYVRLWTLRRRKNTDGKMPVVVPLVGGTFNGRM